MRVESIRLANLASLVGEWYIPLNEPAYQESGIFAITGRTGSGKSTILDAICLALYQITPRLGKDNVENLISRTQKMGFAEVIFTVHGEQYRSSYTIYKGGKKGTGKETKFEVQLENLTRGVSFIDNPASSKKRHQDEIEKIIGMNFMQFRQSILLAQGEFSSFLLASPAQRADILERLTNSDIYGKISEEVHRQFTIKEKEIAALQEQLLTLDGQERLQDQSTLLAELERELVSYAKSIDLLQREQSQLTQYVTKVEQWQELEQKLKELDVKIEQSKVKLASAYDQKAQAQKEWELFSKTFTEEESLLLESKELYNKYISLINDINKNKDRVLESHHVIGSIDESLGSAQESREKLLLEIDSIIEKLDHMRQNYQTELVNDDSLVQVVALERLFSQWQELDQFWQDEETLGKWSTKENLEMNLESLPHNSLSKEQWQNLMAYREHLDKKADLLVSLSAIEEQEWNLAKEMQEQKKSLEQSDTDLWTSKQALAFFEERASLVLGHSCPLCNQKIALLPSLGDADKKRLENNFAHHQSEKIRKDAEYQQLLQNQGIILQQKQQILAQQQDSMQWLVEFEADNSFDKGAYIGLCYEEMLESHNLAVKNERLKASWQEELETLKELEYKKKAFATLDMEFTQLLIEMESKLPSVDLRLTSPQRYAYVYQSYTLSKELSLQIAAKERELAKQNLDYQESLLIEKNLCEKKELHRELIKQIESEIHQQSLRIEEIELRLKSQDLLHKDLDGKLQALRERHRLLQESSRELHYACELALNEKERDEKQQVELHQELDTIINFCKPLLAGNEMLPERSLYQKSLMELELANRENLEKANYEHQEKIHYYAQIKLLQQSFIQQCENSKILGQRTQQLRQEFVLWQRMQRMIGSHDGKKFRTFAQAITLDQVVALANDYLLHMQDRYLLQRDVGIKNDQERLDFIVVDQFQGDQSRGIETLSGGERFLISLSLALGLAGLASERIKVESFFLDEGFGVLDEESLQTVLDALTSLRDMGKVVGLISHVERLKERIEQKIEIKSKGNGHSEIKGLGVKKIYQRDRISPKDLFN